MSLLLVGMNHRTAPLELRERFAVSDARAVVAALTAGAEVDEAVLLCTCNRVEVMAWADKTEAALQRIHHLFERELPEAGAALPAKQELERALYTYRGAAAVRHLFRVASAVDSMVVGEPQILGQVKQAYAEAASAGACGAMLGRLYQHAFAAAKRVRSETQIAERPVSIARVAVELAERIFETLADKSALLVGAGEMIELALDVLQRRGLGSVLIANRSLARAGALAQRFDAGAHALSELPQLLQRCDLVLTGAGADTPLLGAESIAAALLERRGRPIFLIDMGVPRNVEPRVAELDGAYLYDLDDLRSVAEANAAGRREAIRSAEAIVDEESRRFEQWRAARAAAPTIRLLLARAEAIRSAEIERELSGHAPAGRERDRLEALTRSIVNKLLHAPLSRLRGGGDARQELDLPAAARALFALDDPDAPGADADLPQRADAGAQRAPGMQSTGGAGAAATGGDPARAPAAPGTEREAES